MKSFLLFIVFISFIMNSHQTLYLTLDIRKQANFLMNINDTKILAIYSSIKNNSEIAMAVSTNINCDSPSKEGAKCYDGKPIKNQNRTSSFQYFEKKYEGNVYKDNFIINGTNIGEREFIYSKVDNFGGLISFDPSQIDLLYKNNIISNKVIKYGTVNSDSITVSIGEKYSTGELKYYTSCDMVKGYFGCYLKKISISKSREDFLNHNIIDSFNVTGTESIVEFFHPLEKSNSIYGPNNIIEQMISFFEKVGFKCGSHKCSSQDEKVAYLEIGGKAIEFKELNYETSTNIDHLLFGFQTIPNVSAIIDADKQQIYFYSDLEGVLVGNESYFWYFIIFGVVIVLFAGAFVYCCVIKKKKKMNINVLDNNLV